MNKEPPESGTLASARRQDLRNTTTWKLIGPLVWIIVGVLAFINYNWIAGALSFLLLILCTRKEY